jgi:hypothetical protein
MLHIYRNPNSTLAIFTPVETNTANIVDIFNTCVRSAGTHEEITVCYVTNVSIQAFVEGLPRLADVLEATHWTLQTVNTICTLAINSTKYVLLFSGDLTVIRWQVLHMSTIFAVFVSTGVNIADHTSFISSLNILFNKEHYEFSCLYWITKLHNNIIRGNTTISAYSFSRQKFDCCQGEYWYSCVRLTINV